MNLIDIPLIRSLIWRFSRKLYRIARREANGYFETNGEYWLLRNALEEADRGKVSILLDIGANKGNWSQNAENLLLRYDKLGHVHAFEPASFTFSYLAEKFKGSDLVSMHNLAMSNQSGEAEFFVIGEFRGTNSLLKNDGATIEKVRTLRLDDFLDMEQIEHVLILKSDTEGHDLSVLLGGAEALRKGRIDVWQFEYNHRWIAGRSYLKDVFDFIVEKPYLLGKLHSNGIETYDKWHPELELFFESNYVLIRKGSQYERLCSPVHFNNRNVLVPVSAEAALKLDLSESK